MRLHKQLSDDVMRYKNEIHALLVVLFPEFTQVFVDPTRPTALAVLKRYPSAQAIAQTEVEASARSCVSWHRAETSGQPHKC